MHTIGLFNPKCPANIGGVLRAAQCYDASCVVMSGERVGQGVQFKTNTVKAHRRIPVIRTTDLHYAIPYSCIPIGVDLVEGAVDLSEFEHPKNAFYIFGPEDSTLGDRVLSWCKYRVKVNTKYCMNLAATVNVVLYDRISKRGYNDTTT